MRRRFACLIAAAVFALGFAIAAARGEVVSWRPSPADPGAILARLKIDGRAIDINLHIAKPAAARSDATLLIEAGKSDALAYLTTTHGFTSARVDLSQLPQELRGHAMRDTIAKLKQDSGARYVLAHGDADTSAFLAANAELFDGLLLENARDPASSRLTRVIVIFDREGLTRLKPEALNEKSAPANQRRFYLTATSLSAPSTDPSCPAPVVDLSADPARRALLVALEAWTRGVKPPASRFPAAADLAPARMLTWPKIPDLPPPPADDQLMIKIDVDGNETSGLRLPDRALPVATFVSFNAQRGASGKSCSRVTVLPFPVTRAARETNNDPRLSLVERYGSRAYYVATLRVVADRLVRERLLLPQDADAYVAAGKVAPF